MDMSGCEPTLASQISKIQRLAGVVLAWVDPTGDDNIQFFNKDWRYIGDKKMLARTLGITRVPQHIPTDGLSSNRVAQIMSWAANRTTT